jgi:group I intron endonuclease
MNIDLSPLVGIYKIISPSNKVYIGQSINIKNRKESYRRLECKRQPKLYNSFQKYGWEKHQFEIIEKCSIEQLNERETYWKQYYLNQLNENWNEVLFCGLYDSGGGPKSKTWKDNIGKANTKPKSEEFKQKNRLAHLGKKRPPYIGEKISKANIGNKKTRIKIRKDIGIPKSTEHKQNMSLAKLGKPSTNPKKPILQYNLQGNFIKEWVSGSEIQKTLNISHGNIVKCCRGLKKQIGGFIWKYKIN